VLGINLCNSSKESKSHSAGFPAVSLAMLFENNGLGFSLHPAASNISPLSFFFSSEQCSIQLLGPLAVTHLTRLSAEGDVTGVCCWYLLLSDACPWSLLQY